MSGLLLLRPPPSPICNLPLARFQSTRWFWRSARITVSPTGSALTVALIYQRSTPPRMRGIRLRPCPLRPRLADWAFSTGDNTFSIVRAAFCHDVQVYVCVASRSSPLLSSFASKIALNKQSVTTHCKLLATCTRSSLVKPRLSHSVARGGGLQHNVQQPRLHSVACRVVHDPRYS